MHQVYTCLAWQNLDLEKIRGRTKQYLGKKRRREGKKDMEM